MPARVERDSFECVAMAVVAGIVGLCIVGALVIAAIGWGIAR